MAEEKLEKIVNGVKYIGYRDGEYTVWRSEASIEFMNKLFGPPRDIDPSKGAFMFIDTSEYDGEPNIQLIQKRS